MPQRNAVLKPNQAYNVKTHQGTWYTVYTAQSLQKVLEKDDFEGIYLRRIGG